MIVDFQSHYKNIPVENVIEIMKELAFGCQNVIQNAHFIIALLDLVLKNRLMSFQKQYFQHFFGTIMCTLVSIYARRT